MLAVMDEMLGGFVFAVQSAVAHRLAPDKEVFPDLPGYKGADDREEYQVEITDDFPEKREIIADVVTDDAEENGPKHSPAEIVKEKGAVGHIENSGKERGIGTQNGRESSDENSFIPVILEKSFGPVDMPVMEQWEFFEFFDDFAAEFPADKITRVVAEYGGNAGDNDNHRQVHVAERGRDASQNENGFARKWHAHAFQKDTNPYDPIAVGPDKRYEEAKIFHNVCKSGVRQNECLF